MGKKHKRSKAHSRFLLQVRLFCQKTCETYDFVLLFQFENAKTEIAITHPLRRIGSASANLLLKNAKKARKYAISGLFLYPKFCLDCSVLMEFERKFMGL